MTVIDVFSCDQAALIGTLLSACPSVRPPTRPSICPSHLFHHVPVIVSSWNFETLLPLGGVMSMPKVKGQGNRGQEPIDRTSSLNSHMAMKWCTQIELAWKRCLIVFQSHPLNIKVTRWVKSCLCHTRQKNPQFWPELRVSWLWLQFEFANAFNWCTMFNVV